MQTNSVNCFAAMGPGLPDKADHIDDGYLQAGIVEAGKERGRVAQPEGIGARSKINLSPHLKSGKK